MIMLHPPALLEKNVILRVYVYKRLPHIVTKNKKSKEGYSSLQASLPSPLRELTCHMGSHSNQMRRN